MERLCDIPVRYVKGIGPKRAKLFSKMGIRTLEDLLYYFPRRYEDRANFSSIAKLQVGQTQVIKAQILTKGKRLSMRRGGFSIIEMVVQDNTGKIFCVWFNQPYLADYFKLGETLILYGKIERYGNKLQMTSPEFEIVTQESVESLNIGRVVPIYSLPEGLTQRKFRKMIRAALDEYLTKLNDFLAFDIRSRNNLINLAKSLLNIHFPQNLALQQLAYQRLAFEEFFLFQLPLALRKLRRKVKLGIAFRTDSLLADRFIEDLPFKLTQAQKKVIQEIKLDMSASSPMQRLLQGDVGSGKTVVAIIACLIAIENGRQAAFMVPTEILAKQHYTNIKEQISKGKNTQKPIIVGLLTSSANKKQKETIYQEIKEGKIDLIIGTHALLGGSVKFKNLGLVVIDEQHKFGVGQRALLPQKGVNPDILIMTATPIPRTLAITLYGDLDVSIIKELPLGRLPVKTLRIAEEEKHKAYEIAKEQLNQGRQVYIIYPVIEESYALDIAGAEKMYAELKSSEFKEFNLGLMHGRLKQKEQDEIMLKFRNKEIDILVATTVLEVGIDVPNAACMLIEHAQRFGLSQLHQLRGRIGRGGWESFCILVSSLTTPRLEALVSYNDGFHIAEEDLRIRGPGEFFGNRQHGLTELKIGNPLTQMQLLKRAREEAIRLISLDPQLEQRQNILLKEKLLHRFPEYEKLIIVG